MALTLQGFTLREAVGFAEQKYALVGAPLWDASAWTDLSSLGAAWPASDSYPTDPRTCRVPTETEVNVAVQDEVDRRTALTQFRTRDAANQASAQTLLGQADLAIDDIDAELAIAGSLIQTYGTNWASFTNTQLLAATKDVLPKLLAFAQASDIRQRKIILALKLGLERELRRS